MYCINEWNNLTVEMSNFKSVSTLKNSIKGQKKKTHYSRSLNHSVLNSLPDLEFNLVI